MNPPACWLWFPSFKKETKLAKSLAKKLASLTK